MAGYGGGLSGVELGLNKKKVATPPPLLLPPAPNHPTPTPTHFFFFLKRSQGSLGLKRNRNIHRGVGEWSRPRPSQLEAIFWWG